METRDYLMRQFNQLGKVLGKLLANLFEPDNTLNAHLIIKNINHELTTALNFDIDDIIEIPSNEFISRFKEVYEADFVNFEDLAEFLYQIGHLYLAQDDPVKSKALFKQSLTVFQYLTNNRNTFSLEIHQRIKELTTIIT